MPRAASNGIHRADRHPGTDGDERGHVPASTPLIQADQVSSSDLFPNPFPQSLILISEPTHRATEGSTRDSAVTNSSLRIKHLSDQILGRFHSASRKASATAAFRI
jgi:hypothetical protein